MQLSLLSKHAADRMQVLLIFFGKISACQVGFNVHGNVSASLGGQLRWPTAVMRRAALLAHALAGTCFDCTVAVRVLASTHWKRRRTLSAPRLWPATLVQTRADGARGHSVHAHARVGAPSGFSKLTAAVARCVGQVTATRGGWRR